MSLHNLMKNPAQKEHVVAAISRLTERGAASPYGSGRLIATYLMANCEEFTTSEVRGYLKNLEGAIREFREELRGIES
jgi:hypothetical protein